VSVPEDQIHGQDHADTPFEADDRLLKHSLALRFSERQQGLHAESARVDILGPAHGLPVTGKLKNCADAASSDHTDRKCDRAGSKV